MEGDVSEKRLEYEWDATQFARETFLYWLEVWDVEWGKQMQMRISDRSLIEISPHC